MQADTCFSMADTRSISDTNIGPVPPPSPVPSMFISKYCVTVFLFMHLNPLVMIIMVSLIFPSSPYVSSPGSSSRLCKRALYSYFRRVAALGGHSYLLELPSCHSVKVSVSPVLW